MKTFPRVTAIALAITVSLVGCGDDETPDREGDAIGGEDADTAVGADTTGSDTTAGPDTGPTPDVGPGGDTTTPAPSDDPLCVDGAYDEPLPMDTADISGLIAGYQASESETFVKQVLEARYPVGADLVEDGLRLGQARIGHCINLFIGNPNDVSTVLRRLSTIVHECGHFLDISAVGFAQSYYRILPDLSYTCSRIGNDFARSRINGDEYSDLYPEDFYKDTYLDGDPEDNVFDSGDQGYDMLFEETVQYVNSLATDWAFRDRLGQGMSISARDGILTFLWYTTRYLRMARTAAPATYNAIISDPCWREATLRVWGRAWFYLDLSEGIRSLGLRDARLMELATDPNLLDEIDRIRAAHGCQGM